MNNHTTQKTLYLKVSITELQHKLSEQKMDIQHLQDSLRYEDGSLDTLHDKTRRLKMLRAMDKDLNSRLDEAIQSWKDLGHEISSMGLPLESGPAIPWPTCTERSKRKRQQTSPDLDDLAVGYTEKVYQQVQPEYETMPRASSVNAVDAEVDAIRNFAWWMQEDDHYGLLSPLEEAQVERAARAVKRHRIGASRPEALRRAAQEWWEEMARKQQQRQRQQQQQQQQQPQQQAPRQQWAPYSQTMAPNPPSQVMPGNSQTTVPRPTALPIPMLGTFNIAPRPATPVNRRMPILGTFKTKIGGSASTPHTNGSRRTSGVQQLNDHDEFDSTILSGEPSAPFSPEPTRTDDDSPSFNASYQIQDTGKAKDEHPSSATVNRRLPVLGTFRASSASTPRTRGSRRCSGVQLENDHEEFDSSLLSEEPSALFSPAQAGTDDSLSFNSSYHIPDTSTAKDQGPSSDATIPEDADASYTSQSRI
ncbi:hypothetical protein B0H66DRAFT_625875 [Apodospora peruviana]|uniref:Uncharacterized protein n=1 Tax=Apodospora peruviana TaxID=516989 RepID=A0AAE0I1J1_9PEZI|nr:hypothetical protein B0H66DRAFT_625875 [Apodospora peruviana]